MLRALPGLALKRVLPLLAGSLLGLAMLGPAAMAHTPRAGSPASPALAASHHAPAQEVEPCADGRCPTVVLCLAADARALAPGAFPIDSPDERGAHALPAGRPAPAAASPALRRPIAATNGPPRSPATYLLTERLRL